MSYRLHILTLVALIGASACALPATRDFPSLAALRAPASEEITTKTYLEELNRRIYRVKEFEAIRDWGRLHGVRIWAAGGTAAGIAHYVKQDIKRERAITLGVKPEYYETKFGYNYYDVYRSTQDADIVIDGDETNAKELEKYLAEKYAYLQGSKSVWEVRLLRHSRGEGTGKKDALLGDKNFRNQNSDSHSTGLVELTTPPEGEGRVRDLFDWDAKIESQFLHDVLTGKLHFYANPLHGTTARAVAGWNPEILSVIRYFTKAYQYGLEIDPADEAIVSKIIADFDPRSPAYAGEEVQRYISANASKILLHAEDIERARNGIDRCGLRKKLLDYASTRGLEKLTISLNREPLRTFAIGKGPGVKGKSGTGQTAAQLGIDEVAHETVSFQAYESMTMSRRGKPNVYQSRDGHVGEAAAFGDGFYVAEGKKGARGTGITIRFRLDPNAVDGVDFYRVTDAKGFVVVVNANALKVIDESLEVDVMDYLRMMVSDEGADDRGYLQKLRLRIRSHGQIGPEDQAEISALLRQALTEQRFYGKNGPIIEEFVAHGAVLKPEDVFNFMEKGMVGWELGADTMRTLFKCAGISVATHCSEIERIMHARLAKMEHPRFFVESIPEWIDAGAKISEDTFFDYLRRMNQNRNYPVEFASKVIRGMKFTTGPRRAEIFDRLVELKAYDLLAEFIPAKGPIDPGITARIRLFLRNTNLMNLELEREWRQMNQLVHFLTRPEVLALRTKDPIDHVIKFMKRDGVRISRSIAEVPGLLLDPRFAEFIEERITAAKSGKYSAQEFFGMSMFDVIFDPKLLGEAGTPANLRRIFRLKDASAYLFKPSMVDEIQKRYALEPTEHVREIARIYLEHEFEWVRATAASGGYFHDFGYTLAAMMNPVFTSLPEWEDRVVEGLQLATRAGLAKSPLFYTGGMNNFFHPIQVLAWPTVLQSSKWNSLYIRLRDEVGHFSYGLGLEQFADADRLSRYKKLREVVDAKAGESVADPAMKKPNLLTRCLRWLKRQ